ncbi:MFS transporter [Alphaproteobacteria bacterium GH1-50]|uniref:MFS transporter n=1 Tax=Kangsaoukella pontilimi TaxID=2691042 RepID=A0A7C9IF86_9RHOB|nr:MFS transporter [Kangsaoukella pontilimi]MXQ07069.1 MFS transporter [Kangsaoukella pontilimi]
MTETKTQWALIVLLYLSGLLAAWQFAKIALSLAALDQVYPDSPTALLVSGVSVAGIVFGATAGVIIARFGPRRALLVALLAAAALTAGQAALPPYPLMMALRVFEGAAHLVIVVAAPTLMAASAVGRDVPVAMGLWGTFFGVGFATAALVFPVFGSVPGILYANAAGFLILAAALWPILPRTGRETSVRQSFLARHIAIYRNPRLFAPAAAFFTHTIVFLGMLTFLPSVLGPWVGPILPLVALVGTFGAGILARYMPPRTILLAAFLVSSVGMLLAIVLPETARAVTVLAMFGAVGLVPGAALAAVPGLNEKTADQALANGAIAQLGNVGTATSVPLVAWATTFGYPGIATVYAGISLSGLLAFWLIHRKIAEPA